MKWWKGLKAWQKGGVLLGSAHLVIYCLGLILFANFGFGYFALLIEYPWTYLLMVLGLILDLNYRILNYPGSLSFFPYGLLIGTVFYAIIGAICGWIVGRPFKKIV